MQKSFYYKLLKRFGFFPDADFDDEAQTISFGSGATVATTYNTTLVCSTVSDIISESPLLTFTLGANTLGGGDLIEITALLAVTNTTGDDVNLSMSIFCGSDHTALGNSHDIPDATTAFTLCRFYIFYHDSSLYICNGTPFALTPNALAADSFSFANAGATFDGVSASVNHTITIKATLSVSGDCSLTCLNATIVHYSH